MQKKRITRKNGKYFELCLNDGSEQVTESHNDPQWKEEKKWIQFTEMTSCQFNMNCRGAHETAKQQQQKTKGIQQRDAQVLLGRFVRYHKMYCYWVKRSVYSIADSFTHRRSYLWFRSFLTQLGFSFGANVNISMCVLRSEYGSWNTCAAHDIVNSQLTVRAFCTLERDGQKQFRRMIAFPLRWIRWKTTFAVQLLLRFVTLARILVRVSTHMNTNIAAPQSTDLIQSSRDQYHESTFRFVYFHFRFLNLIRKQSDK